MVAEILKSCNRFSDSLELEKEIADALDDAVQEDNTITINLTKNKLAPNQTEFFLSKIYYPAFDLPLSFNVVVKSVVTDNVRQMVQKGILIQA